MTYQNIIQVFNDIANTNPFIKRFGEGDMVDIETDGPINDLYPILWCVPQFVSVNGNSLDYTLRVLVFEPDDEDDSKQRQILSDSLQILLDVIKTFQHKIDYDYTVGNNFTCNPFVHRFVDYCVGWWCDISVSTDFDNSPCDIPGYQTEPTLPPQPPQPIGCSFSQILTGGATPSQVQVITHDFSANPIDFNTLQTTYFIGNSIFCGPGSQNGPPYQPFTILDEYWILINPDSNGQPSVIGRTGSTWYFQSFNASQDQQGQGLMIVQDNGYNNEPCFNNPSWTLDVNGWFATFSIT